MGQCGWQRSGEANPVYVARHREIASPRMREARNDSRFCVTAVSAI